MSHPAYNSRTYRKNRQILLAGDPACVLRIRCNGARATTANHKIPKSMGGGPQLSNLEPACGPCNSSLGNRVKVTRYSVGF